MIALNEPRRVGGAMDERGRILDVIKGEDPELERICGAEPPGIDRLLKPVVTGSMDLL